MIPTSVIERMQQDARRGKHVMDIHTQAYSELEALHVLRYNQGFNDAMSGRTKRAAGDVPGIEHGAYLQGWNDGKSLKNRTRM